MNNHYQLMKKNFEVFLILLVLSATNSSFCYAQSVIAAAAGNSTGTVGSESHTVGQIVWSEVSGTNGTMLQGIEHFFGNPPVGIQKYFATIPEIVVHPNPADDFIKLISEDYMLGNFIFKLYNPKGILLLEKKIESTETEIAMRNYAPGSYLLIIFRNGVPVKTFKIIKN